MTPDPSWPPHVRYFAEQAATGLDVARLGVVAFVVAAGLLLAITAALLIVTAYRQ